MAGVQDPYVYAHSNVLINKEDIRDAEELDRFERLMAAQRLREGIPDLPLTAQGYRQIHHHIFQDVYAWAGQDRTVDIARGNSYFCKAGFIAPELEKRFELLRSENTLKNLKADPFAERAADHVSELNAIHPFREGNGRAWRAFLVVLGRNAGHRIEIQRIDPKQWNEASRQSFLTANAESMRCVVKAAIAPIVRQQDREQSHDHDIGGRGR